MKTPLKIPAFLLMLAPLNAPATPPAYDPDELNLLLAQISASQASRPVIIFDLDDTLIDSRSRTVRILRDFAAGLPPSAPQAVDSKTILSEVESSEIRYHLPDTFRDLGINDPELLAQAQGFWLNRFFSNSDCGQDTAIAGAPDYVRAAVSAGAAVIYLTGRVASAMQACTEEDLRLRGFPSDPRQATLWMKQDAAQADLAYKQSAFDSISALGQVEGVFENEPANINALHGRFPQAKAFFLDTIRSSDDIPVDPGVFWEKSFIF